MRTCVAGLALGVGLLAGAAGSPAAQQAGSTAVQSPEARAAREARGKERYEYWCATCHAGDPREGGRYLPGTASLIAKYKGTRPGSLEERTDLTAPYVKLVIRRGSQGMPFFRKTEIPDAEMEDIAAYLARTTK
jgi:mono/diheme cytochrome c family protein